MQWLALLCHGEKVLNLIPGRVLSVWRPPKFSSPSKDMHLGDMHLN